MSDATTIEQPGGPLSRPYLEVTLAVLALVTIVAFESMAVSTAMPSVARDLEAVRSYGFAFSVMLTAQLLGIVLAGVWTDRSGPLPGSLVGQALIAVGAATCGFATIARLQREPCRQDRTASDQQPGKPVIPAARTRTDCSQCSDGFRASACSSARS